MRVRKRSDIRNTKKRYVIISSVSFVILLLVFSLFNILFYENNSKDVIAYNKKRIEDVSAVQVNALSGRMNDGIILISNLANSTREMIKNYGSLPSVTTDTDKDGKLEVTGINTTFSSIMETLDSSDSNTWFERIRYVIITDSACWSVSSHSSQTGKADDYSYTTFPNADTIDVADENWITDVKSGNADSSGRAKISKVFTSNIVTDGVYHIKSVLAIYSPVFSLDGLSVIGAITGIVYPEDVSTNWALTSFPDEKGGYYGYTYIMEKGKTGKGIYMPSNSSNIMIADMDSLYSYRQSLGQNWSMSLNDVYEKEEKGESFFLTLSVNEGITGSTFYFEEATIGSYYAATEVSNSALQSILLDMNNNLFVLIAELFVSLLVFILIILIILVHVRRDLVESYESSESVLRKLEFVFDNYQISFIDFCLDTDEFIIASNSETQKSNEDIVFESPEEFFTKGIVQNEYHDEVIYRYGLIKKGSNSQELTVRTNSGHWVECLASVMPEKDGTRKRGMCIIRDVTKIQIKNIKLEEQATLDPLTKCLNRVGFWDKVSPLLDSSSSQALMMMDIDDFKSVNDKYGHLTGDNALIAFAGIVSKIAGESSVFSRLGGDEFILFVQNVNEESVIKLCDKIEEEVKHILEPDMIVSCSIGVVFVCKGDGLPEDLYNKADMALYKVKKKKGIHYCIYKDE